MGGRYWGRNYTQQRFFSLQEGTSRQRSGKGAIRKRFPLQKPGWEKNQTNNQVLIPAPTPRSRYYTKQQNWSLLEPLLY